MTTCSKSNLHFSKIHTDGTIRWPFPRAHLTTTFVPGEPHSFTEASKSQEWRQDMQVEFDALLANQTWSLVPPSTNQNLIGCCWIFKTKLHPDGYIERRKARLVAKGYNQLAGLNYSETLSPIVKPTIIRLVLSLVISHGWPIKKLDVQNAFLHGLLEENIYMSQPLSFVHPQFPYYVCKLNHALYRLK